MAASMAPARHIASARLYPSESTRGVPPRASSPTSLDVTLETAEGRDTPRARATASRARVETTRALVPCDIPQGGLATFTAHIAPRMLSRLFEWRGPRRRTRARSARHALRGQNRQKARQRGAPAFFVFDESTSHKPPTRHDTHESRSGRCLVRERIERIDEYRYRYIFLDAFLASRALAWS